MNESTLNRAEITKKLTALDRSMERLKNKWRKSVEFWPALTAELDGAGAEDYEWALKQMDAILLKHDR